MYRYCACRMVCYRLFVYSSNTVSCERRMSILSVPSLGSIRGTQEPSPVRMRNGRDRAAAVPRARSALGAHIPL